MIKIFYVKNQKGFSLIEMMVVVLILGLIVLGLVTFFTGGVKSWVAGQSQLAAQRNARQAIDRMVREIREASIIKEYSTSSKIIFETPWNSDDLEYSWSGSTWDPISEGINPLINNVQSLILTYFDINGEQICDATTGDPIDPLDNNSASKVSKIHIELEVDVDNDENPDVTLNADVNLRNYGLQ